MDALKGFAKKFSSGNSSGAASSSTTDPNAGAGQPGTDYVDKGLASLQQKMGMKSDAATNEKMTDSAREFIEKKTGKDIPDKISN